MKKYVLKKYVHIATEACENLATASVHSHDLNMREDCLGKAIDCADAGMILLMKLSDSSEGFQKNYVQQYIDCAISCLSPFQRYNIEEAQEAIQKCKRSIMACEEYLNDHVYSDQYQFPPTPPVRQVPKWKQVLAHYS